METYNLNAMFDETGIRHLASLQTNQNFWLKQLRSPTFEKLATLIAI